MQVVSQKRAWTSLVFKLNLLRVERTHQRRLGVVKCLHLGLVSLVDQLVSLSKLAKRNMLLVREVIVREFLRRRNLVGHKMLVLLQKRSPAVFEVVTAMFALAEWTADHTSTWIHIIGRIGCPAV